MTAAMTIDLDHGRIEIDEHDTVDFNNRPMRFTRFGVQLLRALSRRHPRASKTISIVQTIYGSTGHDEFNAFRSNLTYLNRQHPQIIETPLSPGHPVPIGYLRINTAWEPRSG